MARNALDTSILSEQEIGWISCETPGHAVIKFYSFAPEINELRETFLYLYVASLAEADITFEPYFPRLVAIDYHERDDSSSPELIELVFENGRCAFFFEGFCVNTVVTKFRERL